MADALRAGFSSRASADTTSMDPRVLVSDSADLTVRRATLLPWAAMRAFDVAAQASLTVRFSLRGGLQSIAPLLELGHVDARRLNRFLPSCDTVSPTGSHMCYGVLTDTLVLILSGWATSQKHRRGAILCGARFLPIHTIVPPKGHATARATALYLVEASPSRLFELDRMLSFGVDAPVSDAPPIASSIQVPMEIALNGPGVDERVVRAALAVLTMSCPAFQATSDVTADRFLDPVVARISSTRSTPPRVFVTVSDSLGAGPLASLVAVALVLWSALPLGAFIDLSNELVTNLSKALLSPPYCGGPSAGDPEGRSLFCRVEGDGGVLPTVAFADVERSGVRAANRPEGFLLAPPSRTTAQMLSQRAEQLGTTPPSLAIVFAQGPLFHAKTNLDLRIDIVGGMKEFALVRFRAPIDRLRFEAQVSRSFGSVLSSDWARFAADRSLLKCRRSQDRPCVTSAAASSIPRWFPPFTRRVAVPCLSLLPGGDAGSVTFPGGAIVAVDSPQTRCKDDALSYGFVRRQDFKAAVVPPAFPPALITEDAEWDLVIRCHVACPLEPDASVKSLSEFLATAMALQARERLSTTNVGGKCRMLDDERKYSLSAADAQGEPRAVLTLSAIVDAQTGRLVMADEHALSHQCQRFVFSREEIVLHDELSFADAEWYCYGHRTSHLPQPVEDTFNIFSAVSRANPELYQDEDDDDIPEPPSTATDDEAAQLAILHMEIRKEDRGREVLYRREVYEPRLTASSTKEESVLQQAAAMWDPFRFTALPRRLIQRCVAMEISSRYGQFLVERRPSDASAVPKSDFLAELLALGPAPEAGWCRGSLRQRMRQRHAVCASSRVTDAIIILENAVTASQKMAVAVGDAPAVMADEGGYAMVPCNVSDVPDNTALRQFRSSVMKGTSPLRKYSCFLAQFLVLQKTPSLASFLDEMRFLAAALPAHFAKLDHMCLLTDLQYALTVREAKVLWLKGLVAGPWMSIGEWNGHIVAAGHVPPDGELATSTAASSSTAVRSVFLPAWGATVPGVPASEGSYSALVADPAVSLQPVQVSLLLLEDGAHCEFDPLRPMAELANTGTERVSLYRARGPSVSHPASVVIVLESHAAASSKTSVVPSTAPTAPSTTSAARSNVPQADATKVVKLMREAVFIVSARPWDAIGGEGSFLRMETVFEPWQTRQLRHQLATGSIAL